MEASEGGSKDGFLGFLSAASGLISTHPVHSKRMADLEKLVCGQIGSTDVPG